MRNRMFMNRYVGKLAVCAAAAAVLIPMSLSAQAPKALVDIAGAAQVRDPHPTSYMWEGDKVLVKEAQAGLQYYTFFYTGTVNSNATVPLGERVERIPIPLTEWATHKDAILTRLTSFYEQSMSGGGGAPAAQKKVVFDEDFNYVEVGGDEPKKPGSLDPRAAAEWAFYYDQFVLWQFYCKRVLLNDKEAVEANSSIEDLQMAEDLAALQGIEGVDVNAVITAAQEIRNQDSPAEAEDIKPGAGGKKPAPPKKPAGGRGNSAPQPQDMQMTVATVFDPEKDYADPKSNLVYREEFIRLAAVREKRSTRVFTEMLARVDERASEMQRYDEWLAERHSNLVEFTEAWGNVKAGETVFMDDTFYLLTQERVDQTPQDALNIVVRDQITPQDILDSNGLLKKPTQD